MQTIFIDTFALAKISKNIVLKAKVSDFINNHNLTLAINVLTFIEMYKWTSSWDNILVAYQ